MKSGDIKEIDTLLNELRSHYLEAKKQASLATISSELSDIDNAGERIRTERKRQNLTLEDLCELSGVAYATLNKIEHGHPSVRLDSLRNVTKALGLKLWIG